MPIQAAARKAMASTKPNTTKSVSKAINSTKPNTTQKSSSGGSSSKNYSAPNPTPQQTGGYAGVNQGKQQAWGKEQDTHYNYTPEYKVTSPSGGSFTVGKDQAEVMFNNMVKGGYATEADRSKYLQATGNNMKAYDLKNTNISLENSQMRNQYENDRYKKDPQGTLLARAQEQDDQLRYQHYQKTGENLPVDYFTKKIQEEQGQYAYQNYDMYGNYLGTTYGPSGSSNPMPGASYVKAPNGQTYSTGKWGNANQNQQQSQQNQYNPYVSSQSPQYMNPQDFFMKPTTINIPSSNIGGSGGNTPSNIPSQNGVGTTPGKAPQMQTSSPIVSSTGQIIGYSDSKGSNQSNPYMNPQDFFMKDNSKMIEAQYEAMMKAQEVQRQKALEQALSDLNYQKSGLNAQYDPLKDQAYSQGRINQQGINEYMGSLGMEGGQNITAQARNNNTTQQAIGQIEQQKQAHTAQIDKAITDAKSASSMEELQQMYQVNAQKIQALLQDSQYVSQSNLQAMKDAFQFNYQARADELAREERNIDRQYQWGQDANNNWWKQQQFDYEKMKNDRDFQFALSQANSQAERDALMYNYQISKDAQMFNYQASQDQINRDMAYQQWMQQMQNNNRDFFYGASQDSKADWWKQQEFSWNKDTDTRDYNFEVDQAKIAQSNWEKQFAQQKKSSGGSSGGSRSSSSGSGGGGKYVDTNTMKASIYSTIDEKLNMVPMGSGGKPQYPGQFNTKAAQRWLDDNRNIIIQELGETAYKTYQTYINKKPSVGS